MADALRGRAARAGDLEVGLNPGVRGAAAAGPAADAPGQVHARRARRRELERDVVASQRGGEHVGQPGAPAADGAVGLAHAQAEARRRGCLLAARGRGSGEAATRREHAHRRETQLKAFSRCSPTPNPIRPLTPLSPRMPSQSHLQPRELGHGGAQPAFVQHVADARRRAAPDGVVMDGQLL
jgi:hypothetical protein